MNFQATQLPDSRCESCYINAYSVLTSAKIMAKSRTIKTRHIVRCCEGSRDDFTMAKNTSSCLPSKTRMNWTSPSKIKSAQEQACSILWRGQLPQLNLLSSLFLCHNHGLSHDHGKWTHDPTRILIPCIHLYIYTGPTLKSTWRSDVALSAPEPPPRLVRLQPALLASITSSEVTKPSAFIQADTIPVW